MRVHANFFSTALLRDVPVVCEIPHEFGGATRYKSIWALHCAMRGGDFFFERLDAAQMARKLNAVIIAPSLGNGFFINSPYERQADCLEELYEAFHTLLPLSPDLRDQGVLGISMGAFGAIAWALRSGHFTSVAAISGIYDALVNPDKRLPTDRNQRMLYGALKNLLYKFLLNPDRKLPAKEADLIAMFATASFLPRMSLFCGEEDFLSLPQTLALYELAKKNSCEVELVLGQGAHDEKYWAPTFIEAAKNLFSK